MLLALTVLGCGDAGEADTGCVPVHNLTWDGWARGFMTTWCRVCHSTESTDRRDAPEGVDFDTRADVQAFSDAIRQRVLEEQTMPLGGGVPAD